MTDWQLRDFVPSDLEALVRLDDASSTAHQSPVFALSDVVSAVSARNPAVVAVSSGQIIGAAVGRVEGDQAWLLRLALDPAWRGRGLGSTLISELERRLVAAGVRRIRALLPADETGTQAFANSGFTARPGMTLFEKSESVDPRAATLLRELGGSFPAAGLWDQVAGMVAEKRLIERRIVLPLAHPAEAHAHGVEPPRAVVLFGPPGTGKTTFARAVASRLAWPFLELFPARMAAAEGGLATGISVAFQRISELGRVLVFIDEVEEIAAHRDGGLASIAVVNELLKALVAFREQEGRLLVCATNSVRLLDPAFLRHGRFDYVLPIGPPDEAARSAMWERHLKASGEEVAVAILVDASANLTPADIAHAARTVSQQMFERSIDEGERGRATAEDYLDAISALRPTLSAEMVREFTEDISQFART